MTVFKIIDGKDYIECKITMEINPKKENVHPDRPLECSECKNPISIHYSEIIKNQCTNIGMCSSCPQLSRRLKGIPYEEHESPTKEGTGLVCGECGTTLANVKVGHHVGCSHCYEVFGDVIINELILSHTLFPGIVKQKKSVPMHVGRAPGETREVSPSLKLIALNEALEETLKLEDYEQAALLRDQIRELTEESEEQDDKKK
jgi:protein arginine kinase activator